MFFIGCVLCKLNNACIRKGVVNMNKRHNIPNGLLFVEDLKLDSKTFNIELGDRAIKITGPTCTICSECCLCETGGV